MIFKLALMPESVEPPKRMSPRLNFGYTAPLVVALRGERDIYQEALKVYWEMNSIYSDF